jgi:2-desacetyl-2-hydroxyethyl bacteriochlorophyllide A dehydrogenase
MKAVLYEGPGSMKLVELPKPVAGAGEVVVKVTMCGICGTDTHSYMHEGILFPGTVFGHETVGVVAELGQGVEGFAVGDRVVVGAPGSCPEGCYYCRIGRPTLCVNGFGRTLGIGPGTQGAYAEYILAKYPDRMLIKIPDSVGDDSAVLFDIFSTAFHGFKRSSFKAGMNVVVVGAGAIGLSMVQLLKLAGAGHITAVNRALKKRQMALEFGADVALSPTEEADLMGKVKGLNGGLGADIVYECAGNPATVGLAVQLARAGGEVILVGTNPEPLSTINEIQIGLFELDLKGSFAYDEDEIRAVLRFMEKGLITTKGMLNKKFRLEDAGAALEELSKTTEPVRYALVP